jgi:amino-acid N-acetyltransferase
MMGRVIEPARAEDLQKIYALLDRCGLPRAGLSDHLATTLVAREANRVVGSAALELYGTAALLRSVAVEQSRRGQDLGRQLTQAVLELACQRGVQEVYLLTETASGFFAKFGFRTITRSEVAPAVRRSVEFTSACPQSAQVMALEISSSSSPWPNEKGGGRV